LIFSGDVLSTVYVDTPAADFRQQKMLNMKPSQSRAARALIDWSQPKLADAAGLGLSTVVDFERERRQVSEASVTAIRSALESAGVIFVNENGEGPGVRLKSMYRITIDGQNDPETKPIGDLDQAKAFAMEVVQAKSTAEVAIEVYYATPTAPMGRIRYDREIGDWISAAAKGS
jgi:transcriptional regulator with XRE-family HTH domain